MLVVEDNSVYVHPLVMLCFNPGKPAAFYLHQLRLANLHFGSELNDFATILGSNMCGAFVSGLKDLCTSFTTDWCAVRSVKMLSVY